jgi:putative protein-disulfide isomerase
MAELREVPLATQGQVPEEGITLYYFYDALCGWCYGFSPVMHEIAEKYIHGQVKLEIISGGMVPRQDARPIGEKSAYILQALPRLEAMTGVQIGEEYRRVLEEGTRIMYSDLAARALSHWKRLAPDQQLSLVKEIQRRIYNRGEDPTRKELYIEAARTLGADARAFSDFDTSEETAYQAAAEEHFTRELGISGFPALVGLKAGKFYLLARGYTPWADLEPVLQQFTADE